jgi:hypothetical protein
MCIESPKDHGRHVGAYFWLVKPFEQFQEIAQLSLDVVLMRIALLVR